MGTTWGYARVSTEDQELGLQITALRDAGVPEANIVQEKASGKAGSDRPLYAALLGRLRDGDRLVVWKVDRLGRSTLDSFKPRKTWMNAASISHHDAGHRFEDARRTAGVRHDGADCGIRARTDPRARQGRYGRREKARCPHGPEEHASTASARGGGPTAPRRQEPRQDRRLIRLRPDGHLSRHSRRQVAGATGMSGSSSALLQAAAVERTSGKGTRYMSGAWVA